MNGLFPRLIGSMLVVACILCVVRGESQGDGLPPDSEDSTEAPEDARFLEAVNHTRADKSEQESSNQRGIQRPRRTCRRVEDG
jgi:hypothetical protein